MHTRQLNIVFLFTLGVVIATAVAWAQSSDKFLLIDKPVDQDLYAASREVSIQAAVNGDLVAAGQSVTVDGKVTGDILVAARDVEISAEVGDDVRAAGQHIRVTSPVTGHIVAAGQTVTISKPVGDWAWLAGSTVNVLDNVGGELKVHAQEININARISGNAELIGENLSLGPNAIVLGDLTWRSKNEADIDPEARIDGEFTKESRPDYMDGRETDGALFFTLRLIVAVAVLFLLFSRPMRATSDRIAAQPGFSLIIGFVVLVVTPVLALLLFVTGIGTWLGLGLLGTYVVVLLLGMLTGLFSLSDLTLRRFQPNPATWQALIAIFVTIVAVGLLTYVPVLGFLVVLAIWLLGLGALCRGSWVLIQNSRHD
jgi:cytoskeletal protein CcmA (bactofilin family)